MSKWQIYEDQPRDFWRTTDPEATVPLIPFIRGETYAEPCYGAGDLEDQLMDAAVCKWRSDVEPQVKCKKKDALTLTKEDLHECACIITNPPYKWNLLRPLLDHLPTLKPTWLLLPSDVMHNKRMGTYINNCSLIVSVGRLYFHKAGEDETNITHARQTSNYAWFLFHDEPHTCRFYGRGA